MPWYAIALMLVGPVALGLSRLAITIADRRGWTRDPRPGYIDLTRSNR